MEENESVYLCKSWMIWHQCFFYWIMNRTCTVFYTEKWIANFLKEMDEEEESLDDESDKEKDVKSENKVSPNQTKHVPWWLIARWWCDNEDENNAPWRMMKFRFDNDFELYFRRRRWQNRRTATSQWLLWRSTSQERTSSNCVRSDQSHPHTLQKSIRW